MKSIIAIILAIVAPTIVAAAPVPAADQTAIRAFLNQLYATYQTNEPGREWGKVIGSSNVFTPSTLKLWSDNRRLLARRGDGVGAIDADIFCACQDYDSIRLLATTLTPLPNRRVAVLVTFENQGRHSLHIQLEKTPAGWRVYDVDLPQQGMLRAVLIKENAELSKGASAAPTLAPPRHVVSLNPGWADCAASYKVEPPKSTPFIWQDGWRATEQLLMRHRCGADTPYAALGLALGNLAIASGDKTFSAAAVAYYQEAVRLATAPASQ